MQNWLEYIASLGFTLSEFNEQPLGYREEVFQDYMTLEEDGEYEQRAENKGRTD